MHIPTSNTVAEFETHQDQLLPFTGKYLGPLNLDVGCGNGIASVIQSRELSILPTLADVSDTRATEAKSLPFFLMQDNKLPFETRKFDSAYMQYVLHHIPSEQVRPLLTEVFRVAKRLVLVEEVTNSKTDIAKALAFDEEVNNRIHPGVLMPVYHYYSPSEVEALGDSFGKSQKGHQVIHVGNEEHGSLDTHLFVFE